MEVIVQRDTAPSAVGGPSVLKDDPTKCCLHRNGAFARWAFARRTLSVTAPREATSCQPQIPLAESTLAPWALIFGPQAFPRGTLASKAGGVGGR